MNLRKNYLIHIILFCFLFSITLISCQSSLDSSKAITEGKKDIENGNYQNAIDILRPYVYYHPKDYEAYFLLGKSFLLVSSNDENKLYKSRYYLSKARDLSGSTDKWEAADENYKRVKSLMGKEENQSAKDLHSSGKEALSLNKKELALNLYLNAANLYLIDENYNKAQKDFSSGLDIALNLKDGGNTKNLSDLYLGLATSYLLDDNPQKCLETILKDTNIIISATPMTALDFNFLNVAKDLLLIKDHRKMLHLLGKALPEKEEHRFVENFNKLIQLQQNGHQKLTKNKMVLLARAWNLIADHSHDLKMIEQSDQAFAIAQKLFLSAGLKEKALYIGKKIEDIKKHSKS